MAIRGQGGGDKPGGAFGELVAPLLQAKAPELKEFPDIVYDGIVDEAKLKEFVAARLTKARARPIRPS